MSTTKPLQPRTANPKRARLTFQGVVQGVGFRPFVYRLARKFSLSGWVANTPQGAVVEVEGSPKNLRQFREEIRTKAPRAAKFEEVSVQSLPCDKGHLFTILSSSTDGNKQSVIPPDLGTCVECLNEIHDPGSRRYRYPFTTCTECGPRFSILKSIPYDRSNTTMEAFLLCSACQAEYDDMANRRFHAEATACPSCGPHLALWDPKGIIQAINHEALRSACAVIRSGEILAVKGLGGFQLWVDASSEKAVGNLRDRKHRPHKPFAVLFPSLESVRDHCDILPGEMNLLSSPESPIVLLRKKKSSALTHDVAPGNPYVGAMLPYTPLHYLMMDDLQIPVVATSGNRSDEPIAIDEHEALSRLKGIADAFLVHDRPIARPVDDSVVRIVNGELMILRRARGYAPTPLSLTTPRVSEGDLPSVVAVGGHLKNTVAVTTQNQVIVSQHVGDLSTPEACAQFERTLADQLNLFNVKPQAVACDLHPDYRSTIFAKKLGHSLNIPVFPVQHHCAHILAAMAEHKLEGPVLGVSWDGTGYGTDGTVWGGEFLRVTYSGFRRVAHVRPFRLPGGEICMREPRRVGLSLLYETYGEEALTLPLAPLHSIGQGSAKSLVSIIQKGVASPTSSSMGRIFDGISSILDVCHFATYEGGAALALEFLAEQGKDECGHSRYSIPLENAKEREGSYIADWRPLIRTIVEDRIDGVELAQIAKAFHQALGQLVIDVAKKVGIPQVVLTGGVFQNALLLLFTQTGLREEGFIVYTHQQVPPNDGGLALGQSVLVAHLLKKKRQSIL